MPAVAAEAPETGTGPRVTSPPEPILRLTVEQYHAMINHGILVDDDPVELLEGWLVTKMPKNPRHRAATRLTTNTLERVVPDDWYVDSQEPITTSDSEPEPDIVVVQGDTRQYLDRHPGPRELALVVEVADATLQRDRTLKKRLYAAARVPVYWIVNLRDSVLEAHSDPTGEATDPTYRVHRDYSLDATVPLTIGDTETSIPVRDLFP